MVTRPVVTSMVICWPDTGMPKDQLEATVQSPPAAIQLLMRPASAVTVRVMLVPVLFRVTVKPAAWLIARLPVQLPHWMAVTRSLMVGV